MLGKGDAEKGLPVLGQPLSHHQCLHLSCLCPTLRSFSLPQPPKMILEPQDLAPEPLLRTGKGQPKAVLSFIPCLNSDTGLRDPRSAGLKHLRGRLPKPHRETLPSEEVPRRQESWLDLPSLTPHSLPPGPPRLDRMQRWSIKPLLGWSPTSGWEKMKASAVVRGWVRTGLVTAQRPRSERRGQAQFGDGSLVHWLYGQPFRVPLLSILAPRVPFEEWKGL